MPGRGDCRLIGQPYLISVDGSVGLGVRLLRSVSDSKMRLVWSETTTTSCKTCQTMWHGGRNDNEGGGKGRDS